MDVTIELGVLGGDRVVQTRAVGYVGVEVGRAPGDNRPIVELGIDVADVTLHEIPAEENWDGEMLAHDEWDDKIDRVDRDGRLNGAKNDELGLGGADEMWAVVWAETAAFSRCQRGVASHAAR